MFGFASLITLLSSTSEVSIPPTTPRTVSFACSASPLSLTSGNIYPQPELYSFRLRLHLYNSPCYRITARYLVTASFVSLRPAFTRIASNPKQPKPTLPLKGRKGDAFHRGHGAEDPRRRVLRRLRGGRFPCKEGSHEAVDWYATIVGLPELALRSLCSLVELTPLRVLVAFASLRLDNS